jgi:A/G-specific adenine glycosylase
METSRFKRKVFAYYRAAGRHDLPWRKTRDPFEILVSEVMLQQTQVSRVLKKYPEFLKRFPTARALADASVRDVIATWQGLGYNRRALLLKRAAETIICNFGGKFPKTAGKLESLPGIGQSTRGAIMAFAYNTPTVFIETNIRAAFIHEFFPKKKKIADKDIVQLIEKTLDSKNPREWYYALMDYGVHLKQTTINPSRKSRHHTKQSPFKGSNREVRSRILKFVLAGASRGRLEREIVDHVGATQHDVKRNIGRMTQEGFLMKSKGLFYVRGYVK